MRWGFVFEGLGGFLIGLLVRIMIGIRTRSTCTTTSSVSIHRIANMGINNSMHLYLVF